MFDITASVRLRPSPYYEATLAEGVTGFQPYNRMLLPTSFGNPEAEYWRLIKGVSQWDVGCERQVQLTGPDAGRLAQILSPRDLARCQAGQGKYAPLCNHAGVLINDPVLLKLDEDRYWLSVADADIWLWAQAIAAERRLDVEISEPDVSPLAVQGPRGEDVVAAIFGDWVRELKYFWFRETAIEGIPLVVARSGWSKQGGFELYLMDGARGTELWNIVREAGRRWNIGPGAPSTCEWVESGLLSFGADTDDTTNPYEVRLGKYVELQVPDEVVGIHALRRIHAAGPRRHQLGLVLQGDEPIVLRSNWHTIRKGNENVGSLTNCVWSYRLQKNIGYALISTACNPGDSVEVIHEGRPIAGALTGLPFL